MGENDKLIERLKAAKAGSPADTPENTKAAGAGSDVDKATEKELDNILGSGPEFPKEAAEALKEADLNVDPKRLLMENIPDPVPKRTLQSDIALVAELGTTAATNRTNTGIELGELGSRIKKLVDTISAAAPPEHIIWGAGGITLTVGDLRAIRKHIV